MVDKIKNSIVWKDLVKNPKFIQEFEECLKRYSYYTDIKDLIFKVLDNKIIVAYSSKIESSELKFQYKIFEQNEFYIDKNNYLVINELSGRLESDRGFKFKTNPGGVINTHYYCKVYDEEGIELVLSRYDDKYSFDKIEYDSFVEDFQSVILGAYNPNLDFYTSNYSYPKVIGKAGKYISEIRSIDNLGIVEVNRFSNNLNTIDKEYYFNVLLNNQDIYTPELIHIMMGQPFARLNDNSIMEIEEEYKKLGLTDDNFQKIAQEKFLKELYDGQKKVYHIGEILEKYDLMINKLKDKSYVKKME